jgi:hypothetical protein
MSKIKPIKHGRSHYMHQLPNGSFLCWGWNFRTGLDCFKKAIRASSVGVYAYVEAPMAAGSTRTHLVPETVVGRAYVVHEAAKIGRAALRERVMPVVRAFAAGVQQAG